MSIRPHQLTREQAIEYRDFIRAREDVWLSDLAHWMAGTGGPIDQMDGSIESLEPLWVWMTDFLLNGAPGLPLGARSSREIAFDFDGVSEARSKTARVLETLGHYLFVVIRRADPEARWDIFEQRPSRVIDGDHHATGIVARGGKVRDFVDFDLQMSGTARALLEGDSRTLEPRRMIDRIESFFPTADSPISHERGPSILAPLAAVPPIPTDDPRRIVPRFPDPGPSTEPPQELVGSEMYFAARGANLEGSGASKPLPEETVAATLRELGFTTLSGVPVTAEALRIDGAQFDIGGSVVTLETRVVDGRLDSLALDPLLPTRAEWAAIVSGFRALGRQIGAKLGREEEF